MLIRADARCIPLADQSVDALVTDPPAGIAFMGREWDSFPTRGSRTVVYQDGRQRPGISSGSERFANPRTRERFVATLTEAFSECLRVLKPGAHGLIWSLPRTSHWTAWALEDAGFEIRDKIAHLFGSGFPKSLDVSKALDTATLFASAWSGWGTALKPAREDWLLVRKPLVGTVAANVVRFGTGGLNIDKCRIQNGEGGQSFRGEASSGACRVHGVCGMPEAHPSMAFSDRASQMADDVRSQVPGVADERLRESAVEGRNLDEPAERLPLHRDSSSIRRGSRSSSEADPSRDRGAPAGHSAGAREMADDDGGRPPRQRGQDGQPAPESGSDGSGRSHSRAPTDYPRTSAAAVRESYVASCTCQPPLGRWPAHLILDPEAAAMLDEQSGEIASGTRAAGYRRVGYHGDNGGPMPEITGSSGGASSFFYVAKPTREERGRGNVHPTVKPIALMRWLCRLVTPPGGLVLDPFCGSGTTGVAATEEGFRFIGCDLKMEYLRMAKPRQETTRGFTFSAGYVAS